MWLCCVLARPGESFSRPVLVPAALDKIAARGFRAALWPLGFLNDARRRVFVNYRSADQSFERAVAQGPRNNQARKRENAVAI